MLESCLRSHTSFSSFPLVVHTFATFWALVSSLKKGKRTDVEPAYLVVECLGKVLS